MIYNELDLNALKVFVAVYENGGFDKASKKMFLSQPAVSIAVKKLEEKLGGKLFVRLQKGVKPTEEGEKFYEECKQALSKLNSAFLNFSPENALKEGSLKIGASTSVIKHLLMPRLVKFCTAYPNIKISFTEVIASRLERYLMNGDIDIAFMEEPIERSHYYNKIEVCKLTPCFVTGRQFKNNALTKEEMLDKKYAVLKKNTNNRALFEKICLQNNLPLNIFYEMASFETLSEICEHHLAVGFTIEEFIKKELNLGLLKKINTPISFAKTSVYALLPKGNASGYVCDAFLSLLKENN